MALAERDLIQGRTMPDQALTEQPLAFKAGEILPLGRTALITFRPEITGFVNRSGMVELPRQSAEILPVIKEYDEVLSHQEEYMAQFESVTVLPVANARPEWSYYNPSTPVHEEPSRDYMMVTSSPEDQKTPRSSFMLVRTDRPEDKYSELIPAVLEGQQIRLVEELGKFTNCEDPSIAPDRKGNLYVGMVAVSYHPVGNSEVSQIESRFFKVTSLSDLKPDSKPDFSVKEMKDVRLIFKRNGKVGVYIRPQADPIRKQEEARVKQLLEAAPDDKTRAIVEAEFAERSKVFDKIFGRGDIGYLEMDPDQLPNLQKAVDQVIKLYTEIGIANKDRLSELGTIGYKGTDLRQLTKARSMLGGEFPIFNSAELFLDQTALYLDSDKQHPCDDWLGANWVEELPDGSHRVLGHKAGFVRDEHYQKKQINEIDVRRYGGCEFNHNPETSARTPIKITRIRQMFPKARPKNEALEEVDFPAGEVRNSDGRITEYHGIGDGAIAIIVKKRTALSPIDLTPSTNGTVYSQEPPPLKRIA